ncbi:MAG: hypothetical protein UT05_C0003G0007 [Parcubacteria group bacterium GW2011_GWF2_38_76]|nr:MAG: hypothetical protein UT05_C0003G0007 [Parcubacteria group bacterium GW2011_GWF2_38_76]HBM46219.1 hypothetical protein [Patescibacteria group bacterium]
MKTYITNLKEFVETQNFKRVIKIVGTLAVVFFVFQAGVFMGFRKASFFCNFGDNFRKNFGAPRDEFRGMMNRDMPNAHGVVGKVVGVSLPNIIVAGDDGVEKIISVSKKTFVRKFRDNIKAEEIKIDDSVIVVGAPLKDGKIDARLIRIMPIQPLQKTATSTNP